MFCLAVVNMSGAQDIDFDGRMDDIAAGSAIEDRSACFFSLELAGAAAAGKRRRVGFGAGSAMRR